MCQRNGVHCVSAEKQSRSKRFSVIRLTCEREVYKQREILSVSGPNFEENALIPVIAQDHQSGDVLMLAYMNKDAYDETLKNRRVCYWSRSRSKLWRKGEESGNVQHLKEIFYDCDADTLLVKVEQVGDAACHEGYRSCFFRKIDPSNGETTVVGDRIFDPAEVYGKK